MTNFFAEECVEPCYRTRSVAYRGLHDSIAGTLYLELAEHPAVYEVAVVARPHTKWGERPMAFVILTPAAEKEYAGRHREFEADLKAFAKMRLPGFARPEWVQVVDELPVSIRANLLAITQESSHSWAENFDRQDNEDGPPRLRFQAMKWYLTW